jgi:hypothetical protein
MDENNFTLYKVMKGPVILLAVTTVVGSMVLVIIGAVMIKNKSQIEQDDAKMEADAKTQLVTSGMPTVTANNTSNNTAIALVIVGILLLVLSLLGLLMYRKHALNTMLSADVAGEVSNQDKSQDIKICETKPYKRNGMEFNYGLCNGIDSKKTTNGMRCISKCEYITKEEMWNYLAPIKKSGNNEADVGIPQTIWIDGTRWSDDMDDNEVIEGEGDSAFSDNDSDNDSVVSDDYTDYGIVPEDPEADVDASDIDSVVSDDDTNYDILPEDY